METYIINGVEVEYDTFDLVNMELFDSEVRRVSKSAEALKGADSTNYLQLTRAACEDILDAFDTLLGDGMADKIFGGKVNAKIIPSAWVAFTQSVAAAMKGVGNGSTQHMNREQRRAAERAERRKEAALRVAQKEHEE